MGFFYLILLCNYFYGIKVYEYTHYHQGEMSLILSAREILIEKESGNLQLNEWYFTIIIVMLILLRVLTFIDMDDFAGSILPIVIFGSLSCHCAIICLISPLLVIKEEYHGERVKEIITHTQPTKRVVMEGSSIVIYKKPGVDVTFKNDTNQYIIRDKNMVISISEEKNKVFYYVTKTDILGQIFLSSYPQEEELTPSKLKSQENPFYFLISKRFSDSNSKVIGSIIIFVVMVILFVI